MAWPHESCRDSWGTSAAGGHVSVWPTTPAHALTVSYEGPLLCSRVTEGATPRSPGELLVTHRDQDLACCQSSWVGVFVHLLGDSSPCPSGAGLWSSGKAQESQPVLHLSRVLSGGGDHRAPGYSLDPMVFRGD